MCINTNPHRVITQVAKDRVRTEELIGSYVQSDTTVPHTTKSVTE